jgi:4-aminobutyrate aminotransferase-like enzyme
MKQTLTLINAEDEKNSAQKLKSYYDLGLIPPEKKAYLTQLRESVGPFMGIESSDNKEHFMLDAASQIATLGLGFNPAPFFGTSHYLESWLNDKHSPEIQNLRKSLERFFQRKLGWAQAHTTLCHSGAEANEIALGYCYKYRKHKEANKILAFEGSFHGRMMVSLSSTWNPDKRVPFEWPGHETIFNPAPESPEGEIDVETPKNWGEVWDQAPKKKFDLPQEWKNSSDPILKNEIESLLALRENLLKKNLFAIIIEPMQCEGGDRYSTQRFHTALLLIARAFQIPVIYDEVQTGFHLGREFFWHRQFDLKDTKDQVLTPDYVICAKKAQVGLVISHCDVKNHVHESYSVASLVRGTHHAFTLDQSQARICEIEDKTRKKLKAWLEKYPDLLASPRARGLSFAINLQNKDHVKEFIAERFKRGLLYYPAGSQTLRFRLNLAFSDEDIDLLFEQLQEVSKKVFEGLKPKELASVTRFQNSSQRELYTWHEKMLECKVSPHKHTDESMIDFLQDRFEGICGAKLRLINSQNFERYRDRIEKIQKENYEPARQTEIEKFESIAQNSNGLGLVLEKGEDVIGIAFAGPLSLFPLERGVRNDPYFESSQALYMLDTTIDEKSRGQAIGRYLKYALTLLAMTRGVDRIQGRNRDRLASAMMSINFSLGAYEQKYIEEDYPDFEKYRDVIYYTTPLVWKKGALKLSHAMDMPLGAAASCDLDWMKEQLPVLTNKVCLSNFVSQRFLDFLKDLSGYLPKDLRHLYSASGQSEAVDKVAKSLWYFSDKKTYRMLTFEGHEFGRGGFLARSLSEAEDGLFPVTHLPCPNDDNFTEVLSLVNQAVEDQPHLAIWIEPLMQLTMQRMPAAFLMGLRELCDKKGIKLVFNETASACYRYDADEFVVSSNELLKPDMGLAYASGQAAFVFSKKENFLEKPLMLISTWDGDEFAMGQYIRGLKGLSHSDKDRKKIRKNFQENLLKVLKPYGCYDIELENGVGRFKGNLPNELSQYFKQVGELFLVCPNHEQMEDFNRFAPIYLKGQKS